MKHLSLLSLATIVLIAVPATVLAQPWSDNFDSYAAGSAIAGQGGWENWTLGSADAFVSNQLSNSAPNSLEINPTSDVVRQFSGATSGLWIARGMCYIPSGSTGEQYWIMLNTYNSAGTGLNWSTQMLFDSDAGLVTDLDTPGPALPIVNDQWVEVRVEINLDTNSQTMLYNGAVLSTKSWTEGSTGSGALDIAVVDLFSNGGSSIFWDDVSLMPETSTPVEPATWGQIKSQFK